MRVPLRQKAKLPRGQTAGTQSIPAPIGGWNARDALASMKPTDAVALVNWFPKTSHVEIRGGWDSHATGLTGTGKTLVTYYPLTGVGTMYCLTASGTYDVTSAGAVGASKLARTNGKHQWVNFGDGTNNYLIAVNGVDKPLYFNGTAWTAVDGVTSPALTGITTTKLVGVHAYKGRLFFIEKDTLSFWYLAAGAAGGALTEFPLDGECTRGGYLMVGATWTIDAGDGLDDKCVFVTSEGEVLVYEGTNPASAAAWSKVGSYKIGKPLGRHCVTQFGGDLLILTENGVFPLSAALQSGNIDYKLALSFKIENAFVDAARDYGANFGWTTVILPAQSALIVNVPKAENGTHEQYVMNTITKSWCKFTGWNAEDFVVFDKNLYFSTGTTVVKAWSGYADGTSNVEAFGASAFTYLGRSGLLKRVTLFRPVLTVNGKVSYLTDIDVDFGVRDIPGVASTLPITISLWNTARWGMAFWAATDSVVQNWTTPTHKPCYSVSGKVKIANNTLLVKWMSCDFVYEYGGVIG